MLLAIFVSVSEAFADRAKDMAALAAFSDLATAKVLADQCPGQVRRPHGWTSDTHLENGIKKLHQDGHPLESLAWATSTVLKAGVVRIIAGRLDERRVDRTKQANICNFARKVAGKQDSIGRFLLRK